MVMAMVVVLVMVIAMVVVMAVVAVVAVVAVEAVVVAVVAVVVVVSAISPARSPPLETPSSTSRYHPAAGTHPPLSHPPRVWLTVRYCRSRVGISVGVTHLGYG